jgi:hypothetical protein
LLVEQGAHTHGLQGRRPGRTSEHAGTRISETEGDEANEAGRLESAQGYPLVQGATKFTIGKTSCRPAKLVNFPQSVVYQGSIDHSGFTKVGDARCWQPQIILKNYGALPNLILKSNLDLPLPVSVPCHVRIPLAFHETYFHRQNQGLIKLAFGRYILSVFAKPNASPSLG